MKEEISLNVNKQELLTTAQVAEQLGLKPANVRAMTRKHLPNKKMSQGVAITFNEAEVTILLEGIKRDEYHKNQATYPESEAMDSLKTILTDKYKVAEMISNLGVNDDEDALKQMQKYIRLRQKQIEKQKLNEHPILKKENETLKIENSKLKEDIKIEETVSERLIRKVNEFEEQAKKNYRSNNGWQREADDNDSDWISTLNAYRTIAKNELEKEPK
jgi:hypothetical protein